MNSPPGGGGGGSSAANPNPNPASSAIAMGIPAMRGVEYRCGDCGARNLIKGGDPVRCRQCGFRILYKTRTKRCEYSILSSIHPLSPCMMCVCVRAHSMYFLPRLVIIAIAPLLLLSLSSFVVVACFQFGMPVSICIYYSSYSSSSSSNLQWWIFLHEISAAMEENCGGSKILLLLCHDIL